MSLLIQPPDYRYIDAHTGTGIDVTSGDTIASAATLDFTGSTVYQYDVTGSVTITDMTMLDGEEHVLRFLGAPLLTQGASLALLGGVSRTAVANDWGIYKRIGTVVTELHYQNAAGSPVADFDTGTITRLSDLSISSSPTRNLHLLYSDPTGRGETSLLFRVGNAGTTELRLNSPYIFLGTFGTSLALVTTADTEATLPAGTHTLASLDDLTGFGTVTDFSAGDLSPLFTTTEATTTTTPALSFALTNAAANTLFGNGTGGSAAPTFMSAGTAKTALGLVIGTDVQAYDADLTTWAGITPGTGVGTFLGTPSSANLRGAITDENGTGAALFDSNTGQTLATPVINGLPTGTGIASGATASTLVARDANGNINSNSVNHGYTTTVTAAGTTTLTVASTNLQYFTGTAIQTVKLPNTTTLVNGQRFVVVNKGTGAGTASNVTVKISSANINVKILMGGGTSCTFTCIDTSVDALASWDAQYAGVVMTTGQKFSVTGSGGITFSGSAGGTLNVGAGGTISGAGSLAYSTNITDSIGSGIYTGLIGADGAADSFSVAGRIVSGYTVKLKGYTVATLPAGVQGETCFVTDALAPTFGAIIVGGGAIVTPCFYNGTNWTSR